MADYNIDVDDLLEKLETFSDGIKDLNKVLSDFLSNTKSSSSSINKEVGILAKRLKTHTKTIDDINKDLDSGFKISQQITKKEKEKLKEAETALKQAKDNLEYQKRQAEKDQLQGKDRSQLIVDLNDKIEYVTNAFNSIPEELRTVPLKEFEKAIVSIDPRLREFGHRLNVSGGEAAGMLIKNLIPALGSFTKALATSTGHVTGIQSVTDLMTGGLDAVTKGLGAIHPKVGKVAELIAGPLKGGLQILSQQAQLVSDSYRSLASQGALFAGGMTEMINSASVSGLALDQYTKVVKDNSQKLALIGGSVTAGAAKMAKVSGELDQEGGRLRRQLNNLGYTYEEQAEGITDYMEILQRTGNLRNVSEKKLAMQTTEYLTNLRAVSAITGEDAKAAKERAVAASMQGAVYAKLSRLGPEAQAKFDAMIKMLPKQYQQAAMEMIAMGRPVTESSAILLQSNQAMGGVIQNMSDRLQDSSVGLSDFTQSGIKDFKLNAQAIKDQGIAMAEVFGQVSLVFGKYTDISEGSVAAAQAGIKAMEEGFGQVADKARAQATTADNLTGEMNQLYENTQKFRTQIQQIIQKDLLPTYATMQSGIMSAMQNTLKDFTFTLKSGMEDIRAVFAGEHTGALKLGMVGVVAGLGALGVAIAKLTSGGFSKLTQVLGSVLGSTPTPGGKMPPLPKLLPEFKPPKGTGALGKMAGAVGRGVTGLGGGIAALGGGGLAGAATTLGGVGAAGAAGYAIGSLWNKGYGLASELLGGAGSFGSDLYSLFGEDNKVGDMMKSQPARSTRPGVVELKPPSITSPKAATPEDLAKTESLDRLIIKVNTLIDSNNTQTDRLDKSISTLREQNSSKLDELIKLFDRNVSIANKMYDSM